MHVHTAVEGRHLLDEWWRRSAGVRLVLIAVPRASDAAKDKLSFAKRAILVLADVRNGRDLSLVLENRHALAGEADDARPVFGDVGDGAGVNELVEAADV